MLNTWSKKRLYPPPDVTQPSVGLAEFSQPQLPAQFVSKLRNTVYGV